jgi:phosphohistidine phosphatase
MLRHAKSDWQADYGGEDRLRPLARRGRRAARTVGRFLAATGQVPDRTIASPALRAQQTLDLARLAGGWSCVAETSEALYGGPDDVLHAVTQGDPAGMLLIVGHEPAWSAVASRLTNGARFRLPAASLLRLDFDTEGWTDLDGQGQIRWLVTPRLLEAMRRKRPS